MDVLRMRDDENLNTYSERLRSYVRDKTISLDQYFDLTCKEVTAYYLSRVRPQEQSGHHGSDTWYRSVRMMILEALERDGRFIDVGSANGFLIESLDGWAAGLGLHVAFHGVEMSDGLHRLSRQRLPGWEDRLFHANAYYWKPEIRYDYVYTMILPDFPDDYQEPFLRHLYDAYLADGGRLILGPWNGHGQEARVEEMGFRISGYCEKSFPGTDYAIKRVVWIDRT